jgi:hypothetical protein
MQFTSDPYEQTTAATDAVLAVAALSCAYRIHRHRSGPSLSSGIWISAFSLLAGAGSLGAVAHGLELTPPARNAVWRPLNLCLGLMIAAFGAGATAAGWGEPAARRSLPPFLIVGGSFPLLSERISRGFLAFIAYEALGLLYALAIFTHLALARRRPGSWLMVAGIIVTIAAAAVQTSRLRVRLGSFVFDHNGVFHLIQIAGLPILCVGVQRTLSAAPNRPKSAV